MRRFYVLGRPIRGDTVDLTSRDPERLEVGTVVEVIGPKGKGELAMITGAPRDTSDWHWYKAVVVSPSFAIRASNDLQDEHRLLAAHKAANQFLEEHP